MTSLEFTTWQDPETGEVWAAVLIDGELILLDPMPPDGAIDLLGEAIPPDPDGAP